MAAPTTTSGTHQTPTVFLAEPSWLRANVWLLRRAFLAAYEDGCFGTAKSAAYSSLLAFFPIVTAVAAVLVQAKAGDVSRQVAAMMFEVVPPGTEEFLQEFFKVKGQQPAWVLVVAVVLAVWGASGAMMSLMDGFQAAYRIPTGRGPVKQRLIAMWLVVCAVLPIIGAAILVLFGQRVERTALEWLGVIAQGDLLKGWVAFFTRSVSILLAIAGVLIGTGFLYTIGPNRYVRYRDAWPGTVVAGSLWLLTTYGFAWYVRNMANYNVLYRGIAVAITLLVWMYLLSIIAFVGCEFNAARERVQQLSKAARSKL